MLSGIFQLAGAIMTLYSILSLGNGDVKKSALVILPLHGQKSPKTFKSYLDRNYIYFGFVYIFVGYLLPVMGFDIGEELRLGYRLWIFITSLVTLLCVAIVISKSIAAKQFAKEEPFNANTDTQNGNQ